MAIQLNPNRINIGSGNAGKAGVGKRGTSADAEKIIIPARASVGNIPAPETLQTMIRSAVSALRSGTFWDRGTIVNLLA